ncbi:hypothetical protein TcWFU_007450 [Taenia crassiceps]|uniref:Uncharacterized protein n=1 Tax=Taenia crassiceps TaxID=6207 RepID=A0ABR4QB99_9CEST
MTIRVDAIGLKEEAAWTPLRFVCNSSSLQQQRQHKQYTQPQVRQNSPVDGCQRHRASWREVFKPLLL